MKQIAAILLAASFPAAATFSDNIPWQTEREFAAWKKQPEVEIKNENGILRISVPAPLPHRGLLGMHRQFNLKKFAGKTVVVSAEIKGENVVQNPGGKHGGAKLGAQFTENGKEVYPGAKPRFGTFDWTPAQFTFSVPESGYYSLFLGTQQSTGTIFYRNLTIDFADSPVDLSKVANMGYHDAVAGDGRGGWSDQGPDNDGAGFQFDKEKYGNAPFTLLDPAKNGGRSVLTFHSNRFPAGLKKAVLPVKGSARYLYLLHTAAFCPASGRIGTIEVTDSAGKTQSLEIQAGREVADQWNPTARANAFVAARWPNGSGGNNGLYVSRFPLAEELGKIKQLTLRPDHADAVWIVAGITLSAAPYPSPQSGDYVVRADAVWKQLRRPESPAILPGSALDLSTPRRPATERIAITDQGVLPVRLFGTEVSTHEKDYYWNPRGKRTLIHEAVWKDKAAIDRQVAEYVKHGFNLVRVHSMPLGGLTVKEGKAAFDPERLDKTDYFIARCKENGIYVQIDTMNLPGFSGFSQWRPEGRARNAKLKIIFDQSMRDEYRVGMEAILNHINPYTGLRYRDDPALASINFNNEQEFAFINTGKKYPWDAALPAWRTFTGNPQAPLFTREEWQKKDDSGRQVNRFITASWRNMLAWYKETYRELGFSGLTTLWEMTNSMHYNLLRDELDFVTMHVYHNHPKPLPGAVGVNSNSQASDIESGLRQVRGLANFRVAGKPFGVNEYASVFCNRYRYEEGMTIGAYAAFQDFDMLLRHGAAVNPVRFERIVPWTMAHDPIAKASMLQEYFLYARGDAKPGKRGVILTFSEKGILDSAAWGEGIDAGQSRLALAVPFSMLNSAREVKSDDLRIPLQMGAAVIDDTAGFSTTADTPSRFDLAKTFAELKKKGILPQKNRSRSWSEIESATGEIYVNSDRALMTVDTPRFQGLCAKAGGSAELSEVKIDRLTVNASVSVTALHKEKTIADDDRLLVIFSTNALNNNQVFADDSMVVMKELGENPTLIETGKVRLRIRNANAGGFKVYALALNGERRDEIRPALADEELTLEIDTARLPGGPALFFEIVK